MPARVIASLRTTRDSHSAPAHTVQHDGGVYIVEYRGQAISPIAIRPIDSHGRSTRSADAAARSIRVLSRRRRAFQSARVSARAGRRRARGVGGGGRGSVAFSLAYRPSQSIVANYTGYAYLPAIVVSIVSESRQIFGLMIANYGITANYRRNWP